jgi:beta-lactamase regulating signal transducer with metallopeptidase domain
MSLAMSAPASSTAAVAEFVAHLGTAGWRGALLLMAAGVAQLALRRSAAGARHAVWLGGFVGVSLVTAFGWLGRRLAILPLPTLPLPAPPPLVALLFEGPVAPAVAAAPTGIAAAPSLPPGPSLLPWVMFAVWAIGCGALLVRLGLGLVGAARLRRRSHALPDAHVARAAAWALLRVGLRTEVPIRCVPGLAGPVTAGLWRPVVLLPPEAATWSPELLRASLCHELGHVRRRDCLTQSFARIVRAVHWWNPLCWIAERRLLIEREEACDDHVLAAGVQPSSYARQLVELGQRLHGHGLLRPMPALLGMLSGAKLANRIEALLDHRRSHKVTGPRTALAAVAMAALLALPACLAGGEGSDARGSLLLVYRAQPGQGAATAAVLARRLSGLGLRQARVSPLSRDRVEVTLPDAGNATLATLRATLERTGGLWLSLVESNPAYTQRLADALAAHREWKLGGDIMLVREHWRGGPDAQVEMVEPYLRGPQVALQALLRQLPAELQPASGRALALDPIEIDQAQLLLLDRGHGIHIQRVASVELAAGPVPEHLELRVQLLPEDAVRVHALTAENVGRKLAIELDAGEVWGAPVINAPIGERLAVTTQGERAAVERLATALRGNSLPGPIELLHSNGGSRAVGVE